MPVLVVGADTELGAAVIGALRTREGEIRAFVSSPAVASEMRRDGIKVALGDVSDGTHVGGAALNCFSVVLIAEAATDERERSFAATPQEVYAAWMEALEMAQPQRLIWAGPSKDNPSQGVAPEVAFVDTDGRDRGAVAADVARLDDEKALPG